VAIPVHLLHNWLEGKASKLLARLDSDALDLLNAVYG
jgi:hypothetical protein